MSFDPTVVKKDFPILQDPDLVFLDSAASSQRPQQVLDAMDDLYSSAYANVHRGAYDLAVKATQRYESARKSVATFINAASDKEIVFTKNATESINLVAASWGRSNLGEGDVVALTMLEHHANIVPWQMLAQERGIKIRWIEVNQEGRIDLAGLPDQLKGASVFAFTAMSNVTGTINPVAEFCSAARTAGAISVVDACQHVPHMPTDVQSWAADFVTFSSHKMLGPSGLGVLWGKEEMLAAMPPFLGGGGMISTVTLDGFTAAELPAKFEAGTPPIAEAAGLEAAISYLSDLGLDNVEKHESYLTHYFLETIPAKVGDDLRLFGPTTSEARGAVFSFELKGVHAHDVSQVLNESGVCVRPGHHCAKPLMSFYNTAATARASVYVYNSEADIDALGDALVKAIEFFGAR